MLIKLKILFVFSLTTASFLLIIERDSLVSATCKCSR